MKVAVAATVRKAEGERLKNYTKEKGIRVKLARKLEYDLQKVVEREGSCSSRRICSCRRKQLQRLGKVLSSRHVLVEMQKKTA